MARESKRWAKGKLAGKGFRPYIPKDRLRRGAAEGLDLEEPIAYRRDVATDGNRTKVVLTLYNRGERYCPNCEEETEHILMNTFVRCWECRKKRKDPEA